MGVEDVRGTRICLILLRSEVKMSSLARSLEITLYAVVLGVCGLVGTTELDRTGLNLP
jgi:hypothetical protein